MFLGLNMVLVKIKLLENGKLPEYKTAGAVAVDCFAREETVIEPKCTVKVPLGFALELPNGYEAQIRGRSGLSSKGVFVQLGTIDSDYRGEVSAIVTNNLSESVEIVEGDRICQMVVQEVPRISFLQVEELSQTERGENGFGSTGQ